MSAVCPALVAELIQVGQRAEVAQLARADHRADGLDLAVRDVQHEHVGDTAPGQTTGTKISGWHLLGPFGNVMLPKG